MIVLSSSRQMTSPRMSTASTSRCLRTGSRWLSSAWTCPAGWIVSPHRRLASVVASSRAISRTEQKVSTPCSSHGMSPLGFSRLSPSWTRWWLGSLTLPANAFSSSLFGLIERGSMCSSIASGLSTASGQWSLRPVLWSTSTAVPFSAASSPPRWSFFISGPDAASS